MHVRRKYMGSHLSPALKEKYNRRSLAVKKGDTVKLLRGKGKDHTGIVRSVNLKRGKITIEGLTSTKADLTEVPRPIEPSNVMITKLDLSDKERVAILERSKA
jgi:large subunit ribosomal protein L24